MRGSRALRLGGSVLIVLVAVVIWELVTQAKDNTFFTPPTEIADRMHESWFSGPGSKLFLTEEARDNILPSLRRLFAGWLLACVIGVALGIAAGRSERLSDILAPLIHFFRAIPPPLLVPVFIALFTIGTRMQVAVIVFGVIWPVLLNSIDGARHVDSQQIEAARAFRFSPAQRLFRVILPSASPKIFAGLRLSLSNALILMVISEYMGGVDGIGFLLQLAKGTTDLPAVWSCIVLLGILGLVLNTSFMAVERRVLAWHYGARRVR